MQYFTSYGILLQLFSLTFYYEIPIESLPSILDPCLQLAVIVAVITISPIMLYLSLTECYFWWAAIEMCRGDVATFVYPLSFLLHQMHVHGILVGIEISMLFISQCLGLSLTPCRTITAQSGILLECNQDEVLSLFLSPFRKGTPFKLNETPYIQSPALSASFYSAA